MTVEIKKTFRKDLKKIKNKDLNEKIGDFIEGLKTIDSIALIPNIKKIEGYEKYYRIRYKDYRIGIKADIGRVTLMRVFHRKDIYKYFP